MASLADRVTGALVLHNGWIGDEALQGAYRDAVSLGLPLGQILVRSRTIRPADLLELMRASETATLICPRCQRTFPYRDLEPRGKGGCLACQTPLEVSPGSLAHVPKAHATGRMAPVGTGRFLGTTPGNHDGAAVDTMLETRPDSRELPLPTADRSPGVPLEGDVNSTTQLVAPMKREASGRFLGTSSRRLSRDFAESFGPYELVDELGRGGMGVVYKARQPGLDRYVALKILLGGEMASSNQVKRFKREAEFAAKLKHPGIVQIHDVGQVGDHHFLTMDFVDGVALGDVIKQNQLSDRRAVRIARDMAAALQHAHGEGVIHRDVKPANVMLDTNDQPVLTDFGLARRADLDGETTQLTRDGAMVGTPYYMSPEQASGKRERVCPKSDVFALGVVLYQLLTGELPFKAETQMELSHLILFEDPVPLLDHRPDLDLDLQTILQKSLEKNAGDRYSAEQLRAELDRWLEGEAIEARPLGILQRGLRKLARHRRLVFMGSAAVVIFEFCAWGVGRAVISYQADSVVRALGDATDENVELLAQLREAQAAASRLAEERGRAAVATAERALLDAQRAPVGVSHQQSLVRAVDAVTQAIELEANAKNARLRVWRARARLKLRQRELAEFDLMRAAELDPRGATGAEASYLLSRSHRQANREDRSRRAIEDALERLRGAEPTCWQALLEADQAMMLEPPNLEAAKAAVARAERLDPRQCEVFLAKGNVHSGLSNPTEARAALQRATELDPKEAGALLGLAQLQLSRNLAEATRLIERALAVDPRHPDGLTLKAMLQQEEGDMKAAIATLERVIQDRPDHLEALFFLSQLYRATGNPTQAEQKLRLIVRNHPSDYRPHQMRAFAELREGRFDRALQYLSDGAKLLDGVKGGEKGARMLWELFEDYVIRTGNYDKAERYARARLANDPLEAKALMLLIQAKIGKEGPEASDAFIDELIKEKPKSSYLRGLNLKRRYLGLESKSDEKALRAEVEAYLAEFPKEFPALSVASEVYCRLDDEQRAREVGTRMLDLGPEHTAEAHFVLGQMAYISRRFEEARGHALSALRAQRNHSNALFLLASILVEEKQADEARSLAIQAESARPFDEPATKFAVALLIEGARAKNPRNPTSQDRRRARAYFGRALSMLDGYLEFQRAAKRPPAPELVTDRCRILLNINRQAEAVDFALEVATRYPKNYLLQLAYAKLLIAVKSLDEADRVLTRAEALAPKSPSVRLTRRELDELRGVKTPKGP